ncbi:MAG: hypothetical protein DRJ15_16180 [Bacteroidetes bacterium]|nr:MAG: hypothetical protein DRJ15_16180 [Bacteroidota bacterium]
MNHLIFNHNNKVYKISSFGSQLLLEEISGQGFTLKTIGYFSAWTHKTIESFKHELNITRRELIK